MMPGKAAPMRSKALNQKQIAERLGISTATVSLVLRDPETNRASAETKQRILAHAAGTPRRPRPANGTANTLLFVMSGQERRFFYQQSMLNGAQERASELGLKLEVANPRQDLQALANVRLKGVLLETQELAEGPAGDLQRRFRTVTLNSYYHSPAAGLAVLDDPCGGFRLALTQLRELGHTRIGFLSYHDIPEHSDWRCRERVAAFVETCRYLRLTLAPDAIELLPSNVGETIDRSREIAAVLIRWRQSPTGPTVVFCHNDLLAARVTMVGLGLGIRVPEHLSLIGYDNEPLCQMLSPQLTSICPRFAEMGRIAVSALADEGLWGASEDPCRIIVPARLAVRDSVAAAPVSA